MDTPVISLVLLITVCVSSTDAFTWQPVSHNTTTAEKFTWGPIHNATNATTTTPKPNPSSTSPHFTWPNLHSTTASKITGNDLIPIIVGAALGGLVVIVLASYIIVQYRLKKQREEGDREQLVE